MKQLCVLLFFLFQFCNSQTTCFNQILIGYNVSAVTDDNQFIWVGTFNNGLISIDKITSDIQTYMTSNSNISSNTIKSVLHINGRLYVSTDLSLMQFSNGSFQQISTTIQGAMTTTPNGNLAVASQYEFNILNANNQITYTKDLLTLVTPSCCGMTTYMEYDNTGKLWLSNYAFYEYDILSYDGSTWNVYDVTNSILPIESPNFLNGITTHNNEVLATNWAGMFKFENNVWTNQHSPNNLTILNDSDNIEGLVVNAIKYNSQGVLWIGAGEYDNSSSGKIAFRIENNWEFLDNNSETLPGVNLFEESQYDSNTVYAASNDGLIILDLNCLALSIEDYETTSNDVLVFPNPTTEILNIKLKNDSLFSFQLINVLGQKVAFETDVNHKTIDVSRYSSGLYNLVIYTNNSILKKKILIE